MMDIDVQKLTRIKNDCLRTVINLHKMANAGHIGSSLSCLDILVYLYFKRMNKEDKFILSKGHSATALYAVLAKSGIIPEKLLDTFYKEGTLLGAHPPCNSKLEGIPFGTGSLGHGLSLSAGIAWISKLNNKKNKIYCVLSDGDCDEGSTWEAALFAAQHKLNNLTIIVDNNNLQGFGETKEILNLEPLDKKFESFNFDVVVAKDGNDFNRIHSSFQELDSRKSDKPKCIIAKTVKGKSISFMENKMEWHYLPLSDKEFEAALKEMGDD